MHCRMAIPNDALGRLSGTGSGGNGAATRGVAKNTIGNEGGTDVLAGGSCSGKIFRGVGNDTTSGFTRDDDQIARSITRSLPDRWRARSEGWRTPVLWQGFRCGNPVCHASRRAGQVPRRAYRAINRDVSSIQLVSSDVSGQTCTFTTWFPAGSSFATVTELDA
jgi:hypothetical protein